MNERNTNSQKKTVYNCSCSVPNCFSRKGKNRDIHYHSFPKKDASTVPVINSSGILETIDRRKAWIEKLFMKEPVSQYKMVCSLHFQNDDYLSEGSALQHLKSPKLKSTAVPSRNLPNRLYMRKNQTRCKSSKKSVYNSNCSVPNCFSKKGKNRDLHFHSFPKKDASTVVIINSSGLLETMDRREAWIQKLNMKKPVSQFQMVCSLHFRNEDYLGKGSILQLKKSPKLKSTAVPSLNLPNGPSVRKINQTRCKSRLEKLNAIRNKHILGQSQTDHTYSLNHYDPDRTEQIDVLANSDLTEGEESVLNMLLDILFLET